MNARSLELLLMERPAPGAEEAGVRTALPAATGFRQRRDRQPGGPVALATSGTRAGLAGGFHSDGGGNRTDRCDRRLGHRGGLPPAWRAGAATDGRHCASRSTCPPHGSARRISTSASPTRSSHRTCPPRQSKSRSPESILMSDAESTATTLHALDAMGVRIAIDDFGTGYLARLPEALPGRYAQGRPFFRQQHRRQRRGRGHLLGHHRSRAQPAPGSGCRGRQRRRHSSSGWRAPAATMCRGYLTGRPAPSGHSLPAR